MYRIVPERVNVVTILGGNRYLVPFNRGIATPVCGLVRNDRKLGGEATNTNFSLSNALPKRIKRFAGKSKIILDFSPNLCYYIAVAKDSRCREA